jgi:hypothetical protein
MQRLTAQGVALARAVLVAWDIINGPACAQSMHHCRWPTLLDRLPESAFESAKNHGIPALEAADDMRRLVSFSRP